MFKRSYELPISIIINKQYKGIVDAENIFRLSKNKLRKIFKREDKDIKNIYLHNVIEKWWRNAEETEENFKLLKKIIRRCEIVLNQVETHNIFLIEERIFAKTRHIKQLDVNIDLKNKEVVGVKYLSAILYNKKTTLKRNIEGDLLISNKRLIIKGDNQIDFYWTNISNVKYENYGFEFKYKGAMYVIRIHDQQTLNNTIMNIYKKKVKEHK